MFIIQGWSLLSSSGNGKVIELQDGTTIGANSEYAYCNKEDTIAEMSESGYFSQQVFELNQEDTIYAVGSDGEIEFSVTLVDIDNRLVTVSQAASTGDMDGPTSSLPNSLARFSGTTGKLLKSGLITASDLGELAGILSILLGGSLVITQNGISFTGSGNKDLVLTANEFGFVVIAGHGGAPGGLKLFNSANSFSVSLSASQSMAANSNYTLPPAVPTVNGQIMSGNTDGTTSWASASGFSIPPHEVTTTTATMAVNSSYCANNAALVTLALPSTAALGSLFLIAGKGAGGWAVQCAAGQTIFFGNQNTTVGGAISSTNANDSCIIYCTEADTKFTFMGGPQGNLAYA